MNLREALDTIVSSSIRNAMKRPSMGGYFFRSAISTATGTEGDYTLTLRKRNDDNGDPVDYVYSYDASAGTWTAPSEQTTPGTNPSLTGEFFGELLGDDWLVGTAEDFETARTGGSGDEW